MHVPLAPTKIEVGSEYVIQLNNYPNVVALTITTTLRLRSKLSFSHERIQDLQFKNNVSELGSYFYFRLNVSVVHKSQKQDHLHICVAVKCTELYLSHRQ